MTAESTEEAPVTLLPYDFVQMARTLVGAFPEGSERGWLEQSWSAPDSYRDALFERSRAMCQGFSSRADATIDTYHDLIEVNLGHDRCAWCHSEDGQNLQSLSYDAVHSAVVGLADAWRARGVVAAQTLTVLGASDPSRMIAVLAGFYLGLQVSLIEPRGRSYVRARLALLQPDHVATSDDSLAWYGEARPVLPLVAGPPSGATLMLKPHRYGPDEALLAFVSPLAEGEESLATLSAVSCMTAILSDVQLLFPLRVGERVAAVGRDRGLIEPTLWLATFVAGGTYVDLDANACIANPDLLDRASVHVMLPGAGLLDLLLGHSKDLTASWKRWSLDPSGKLEWQRWWRLAERLEVRGVPGFNAIYIAALGGTLAVSPKALKPDPMRVVPAPGLRWVLHDVTGVGAAVPVDSGLLAVEGLNVAQVGQLMVAGAQSAYGLAGSLASRVDGCPFPVQAVVAHAESHYAVQYAAVVVIADAAIMNHGSARLLLFVDPLWGGASPGGIAELCRVLQDQVEEELGAMARPDRTEGFVLCPRLRNGGVDPVWVTGQYISGMLYKKRPMKSFHALAKLRRLFADEAFGEATG